MAVVALLLPVLRRAAALACDDADADTEEVDAGNAAEDTVLVVEEEEAVEEEEDLVVVVEAAPPPVLSALFDRPPA